MPIHPAPSTILRSPPARRWVLPDAPPPGAVAALVDSLRLPPALCRILVQRGFAEVESARAFLRPHPSHIHSPQLLAGIGDAVARLARAVRQGETILVHGDYDVDGICSTTIFVRALRRMGGRVEPFVPHRIKDGYDLSEAGIAAATAVGATVILTGDCGVVAHDAVDQARANGIDVIVTDHHTPGETLPNAVAVVNPNRSDCCYPDKGLAGAGVAYKVCVALASELGLEDEQFVSLLDLVAVATIADLAPLTRENRALVRWGLSILPDTPNPGLRALLRTAGLGEQGEVTAGQVGYVLAPRINAVGRMGEASLGVRLLLTDDASEAQAIAAQLEEANRWRREVDARTLREAMALIEEGFDPDRDRGIVLASSDWHPGVIGIVASRVVERVHRPVIMIAVADGEGRGSARSIPGFHLYDAMLACSEHLTRFGGHRLAAGCSLPEDRIDAFREAFDQQARRRLSDEMLVPETRIDLEVTLAEADAELYRLLRYAAPFGVGNPTPSFVVRGVRTHDSPRVVGSNHLRMVLQDGDTRLEAMGFGLGERVEELRATDAIDVVFKLEENVWRGRTSLRARLVDFRRAE